VSARTDDPVPLGHLCADVFEEKSGAVLVVLASVDRAPAWPLKKGELPSVG
jgi:hypothetical protein